jgi:hypothetical protein
MLIEELIESAHCVFVGLVTCDRRDRDLMAFSPSLEVLLILVNIANAGLGFGNDSSDVGSILNCALSRIARAEHPKHDIT